MHLNHEYFWRVYKLNEYIYKIYMHSLLRPLGRVAKKDNTQLGFDGTIFSSQMVFK